MYSRSAGGAVDVPLLPDGVPAPVAMDTTGCQAVGLVQPAGDLLPAQGVVYTAAHASSGADAATVSLTAPDKMFTINLIRHYLRYFFTKSYV